MMPLQVGIAIYAQYDGRSRPISPHWALVIDEIPTSTPFRSPNTGVYQVVQPSGKWMTYHRTLQIGLAPSLVGVVHLGGIQLRARDFLSIVNGVSVEKEKGDDPSGLVFWGCESWCIKVLERLVRMGIMQLPAPIGNFYDLMRERIQVLKEASQHPTQPFPVIPLV